MMMMVVVVTMRKTVMMTMVMTMMVLPGPVECMEAPRLDEAIEHSTTKARHNHTLDVAGVTRIE